MDRRRSVRVKGAAEVPIDENRYKDLLGAMMSDPRKKAILQKLMKEDKEAVEKYKQNKLCSPVNRVRSKVALESPTAQYRRRVLEKVNDDPLNGQAADLPIMPFEKLLDGVRAYVEIRHNKEDLSVGVKAIMESMGARIMQRLSSQTTHVIYKDGSYETYRRARAMNIHVVSILWLEFVKKSRKRLPESDYPVIGVNSSNITETCEYINANYEKIIREEKKRKVPTKPQKRSRSQSAASGSSSKSFRTARTSQSKATSGKLPESEVSESGSKLDDTSDSKLSINSSSADSVIPETPSPGAGAKNRRRTRTLYTDNISKLIEESRPKSTSKATRRSVAASSPRNLVRQTLFNSSAPKANDEDSRDTSSPSQEVGKYVTRRRKTTRFSASIREEDGFKVPVNGKVSLTSDCSSTDVSLKESKADSLSAGEIIDLSLQVSADSAAGALSHLEEPEEKVLPKEDIKLDYHGVSGELKPKMEESDKSTVPSTVESLDLKISTDVADGDSFSFGLRDDISMALSIVDKDILEQEPPEEEGKENFDGEVSPKLRKSPRNVPPKRDEYKRTRRKLYNPEGTISKYFTKNKVAERTFKMPQPPADLVPIIMTQTAKEAAAKAASGGEDKEEGAWVAPIKPILNRKSSLDFVQKQPTPRRLQRRVALKRSIVCSRFHRNEVSEFIGIVGKVGGFSVENNVTKNTTHLVLGDCSRTLNVLRAMARGIWILKPEWLHSSKEQGRWLPEEPFEFLDLTPNVQVCRLEREAFGDSYSMDVFQSCGGIHVSPNTNPGCQQLKELIRLCKGDLHATSRSASVIVGGGTTRPRADAVCVRELWILDSIFQNRCKNPADYAIDFN